MTFSITARGRDGQVQTVQKGMLASDFHDVGAKARSIKARMVTAARSPGRKVRSNGGSRASLFWFVPAHARAIFNRSMVVMCGGKAQESGVCFEETASTKCLNS